MAVATVSNGGSDCDGGNNGASDGASDAAIGGMSEGASGSKGERRQQ